MARSRSGVAQKVCECLTWRQFNGHLKETVCLEALCKMEKQGLLNSPLRGNHGGYQNIKPLNIQEVSLFQKLKEESPVLPEIAGEFYFELVKNKVEKRQWRYFLDNSLIEPTNNRAEPQLRPYVIMRKITFGNRSESGAENHQVLMSIIQTGILNSITPLEIFQALSTKPLISFSELPSPP